MYAFCMLGVQAQDVIITKEAGKISAKVIEVGENEVKYKNFDNLNGPVHTLSKNRIASILYQNGSVETFEAAQETQAGLLLTARGTSLYLGTVKLKGKSLDRAFAGMPDLYIDYKEARSKVKWSYVPMGAGAGCLAAGVISGVSYRVSNGLHNVTSAPGKAWAYWTVAGTVIGGVGVYMYYDGNRKIRRVTDQYNQKRGLSAEIGLVATDGGVGLRVIF